MSAGSGANAQAQHTEEAVGRSLAPSVPVPAVPVPAVPVPAETVGPEPTATKLICGGNGRTTGTDEANTPNAVMKTAEAAETKTCMGSRSLFEPQWDSTGGVPVEGPGVRNTPVDSTC